MFLFFYLVFQKNTNRTMTISDEAMYSCVIPYKIWRVMAYPFAYSERDLLDLFNNSNYILKEVYVEIIINHRSKKSYCSMFCVLNDNNYNNINNMSRWLS
jgi:hypothetical protein